MSVYQSQSRCLHRLKRTRSYRPVSLSVCNMTLKAQSVKYWMMMHRNTDVEQIEICLCLGQISLAVSGGGACGGRNGGARGRPVGLSAFLKNV